MKPSRPTSRRFAVGLALATILALVGCSGQPAAGGTIQVTNAWARTSPAVADAGAAYMELANPGGVADALVSVAVSGSVAARAELHETVAASSAMGSGMMEMRQVERIAIASGSTVELKPGGYHVMLLDLAQPLVAGATVELTLTFDRAGAIVVTAEVRDDAP